jgi:hypothetical protein
MKVIVYLFLFLLQLRDQNIEEATTILKPPNSEEYPYDSYEFANVDEHQSYMDRAANESIKKQSVHSPKV